MHRCNISGNYFVGPVILTNLLITCVMVINYWTHRIYMERPYIKLWLDRYFFYCYYMGYFKLSYHRVLVLILSLWLDRHILQEYLASQWVSSKVPWFIKVSPFKAAEPSLELLTPHRGEALLWVLSMLFALGEEKSLCGNRKGLLSICEWTASALLCCVKQQFGFFLWGLWRGYRVKLWLPTAQRDWCPSVLCSCFLLICPDSFKYFDSRYK